MHLSSPWTPIKKRQISVFFAYCAFRMSVCVFQIEGEALARGVSTQLGRLAVWVRVALSTLALQINIFILACNTVALQGVPNLLTDWDGAMRYMLLPWATGDRAAPHRYSFMIYTRPCMCGAVQRHTCGSTGEIVPFYGTSLKSSQRRVKTPLTVCWLPRDSRLQPPVLLLRSKNISVTFVSWNCGKHFD